MSLKPKERRQLGRMCYDALAADDPSLIDQAIAVNADILQNSIIGQTWLHLAAAQNKLQVAKHLHKLGLDINQKTDSAETPLYFAAREGHLEMVKWLLNNGAHADPRLPNNEAPLVRAANRGFTQIVRLLLESGADPNSRTIGEIELNPLEAAEIGNYTDTIALLKQYGASKM